MVVACAVTCLPMGQDLRFLRGICFSHVGICCHLSLPLLVKSSDSIHLCQAVGAHVLGLCTQDTQEARCVCPFFFRLRLRPVLPTRAPACARSPQGEINERWYTSPSLFFGG